MVHHSIVIKEEAENSKSENDDAMGKDDENKE